jgi:DNA-directed RNA polymerase specialized sigma subunit
MTKRQIEQAYSQYQPLLHKLSHQCASRCGRPEAEVYGQACWLFTRACNGFDPAKGKLETFVYANVRNGLIKWGTKNCLPVDPSDIPEQHTSITPRWQAETKEWLKALSAEAREIAAIILNGPAEVLELTSTNGKTMIGDLRKYLLKNKKWGDGRRRLVDQAIAELRAAVKSLDISVHSV